MTTYEPTAPHRAAADAATQRETDEAVWALADAASRAQSELAQLSGNDINAVLHTMAQALCDHADDIAAANASDMRQARDEGMDDGKLDRLLFDAERVRASAQGVLQVAALPNPVGEVVRGSTLPNGLRLQQVRVPLGVVGMIYEARPNVTVDVASLCVKSGNAVILRGGHAARRTNEATVSVIGDALQRCGVPSTLVGTVDAYGRMGADAMMRARGHIDVLVPRGSAALIATVVERSCVPVIETGAGNVHIYLDASADVDKAVPIVLNAKTQRVGVCNAAEKLVVHADVLECVAPAVIEALHDAGVCVRADERAYAVARERCGEGDWLQHADEADWDTEYLAMTIGVVVVDGLDEAIAHINAHSTGHTDAIIAEDYAAVETFTQRIDSAVVLANASTRFTDGGMFGFGAELGISTQKMHARGPMGLREMTTTKWIGYGTGQVRV